MRLIRPLENGMREFEGILQGRQDSLVMVDTPQGPVSFEAGAASYVKMCDDEDLF